jgi:hypothetical protein
MVILKTAEHAALRPGVGRCADERVGRARQVTPAVVDAPVRGIGAVVSYTRSSLEPVTITLDEAALAGLREAAAHRGASVEEAAAGALRLGPERERVVAQGIAALDRLDREQEPIDENEAMRITIEGVRALRAERRAGSRR